MAPFLLEEKQGHVHTRYIPSGENPADNPSRGIYGTHTRLLSPITIPDVITKSVSDYDSAEMLHY